MSADVDTYIEQSQKWPEIMEALRPILLECGLTESIKWRSPCFSHDGRNIVIFQEFKDFFSLMFFKGAFLEDAAGVLQEQGPNSRSARRIPFTSVDQVNQLAGTLKKYVAEAIDVADADVDGIPAADVVLVEELQSRLEADPELKAAFEGLTPGRQREYNLYFSSAKQPITRIGRIDKYAPKILAGKGFRDR